MKRVINTKPPVINITAVETGFTQSRIIFSSARSDNDLVGIGSWVRESTSPKSANDYSLVGAVASPLPVYSLTPGVGYTLNIAYLDEFSVADADVLAAQYLEAPTLIEFSEVSFNTLSYPQITGVDVVSGGREIGNNFGAIDFTITGGSSDLVLWLEVLDNNGPAGAWKSMYFGGYSNNIVVSLPTGSYSARITGIRRFIDNTEDMSPPQQYPSLIEVSGSGIAQPNPVTGVVVQAFKSEEVTPIYSLKITWGHDDTTNGVKRNFSVQLLDNPSGVDPATLNYSNARTEVAIDSTITISPFPYRKLVAIKLATEGFGTLSSTPVFLNVFVSSDTADSAISGYTVPVVNSAPTKTRVQIDDQYIRGYKTFDAANPLLNNLSFEFDAATGNVKIGAAGTYAGEQITTPFLFDATNARLQISGHTITDKITAADYVMGWLGGLPPKLRTANRVTYDDTAAGLWAGYTDAATFKFSLGDATKYIKWDGSNLVISGNVTIDGGPSLSQMQREVFVYIRSASAPSTPTGGSVNFSTGVVTPPTSWSLAPPTGTNPLYMSSRLFTSDGQPPQSTAWTTPGIIASNGNFIEFRYQASSTQPATPTGSTPAGWSTTPPTGTTLPVWVVQGTKNAAGTLQGTWSTPVRWNGLDGAPGVPGEPGAPAKSIIASSSRQYFTYTSAGVAVPASQSAIISFTGSNLGTVTFTTSPTVTLTGTGSTRTLDVSAMGANEIVTITVSDGTVSDSVSVVKLRDGAGGLVGFLTNESHVVSAANNGTGYSLTGAGGTFRVFQGLTEVTTSCTFSVTTATVSGLTMSINASTGVYTLSGASWTSDSASFTLNAVFNGSTISKVYSISKSKAGASVTGARGAGFWRINTGTTAAVANLDTTAVTAWFTNGSVGPNVGAPVSGEQVVLINSLGASAAYAFTTSWAPATAFINGSMVVNGSIGAESLTVDVLNGKSGTIGVIQTRAPGASDRPRVEISSTQVPLIIQNNQGNDIFSVSTLPSGEAIIDLKGRLQNNTIQDAAFFTRAGIDRLRERLAEPPEGSSTTIYGGFFEFLPATVNLTTPTVFSPSNYIAGVMLHNNGQQITARLKLSDYSGILPYNPSVVAPVWEVKIRYRTSADGVTWAAWADIAASIKSFTGWNLSSNEPGSSYSEYGISAIYEHVFTLPNPEGTRLEFMAQARRTLGASTNPRLSEGTVQAPVKIEGMVGGLVLTKNGNTNILTSSDGSSVSFSGATPTEAGLVTTGAQTFAGVKSGTWSGNGSGLTSLNASSLDSGTVPNARLPTTATRWPTWAEVTNKPSSFATNWADIPDKPATATRWPTLSEITYDGDISINNGEGMRIRATNGGWARGITAFNNSMSTRLAGAGFGGSNDTLSAFMIGFNSEWWSGGYVFTSISLMFPTSLDAWIGASGNSVAFYTAGNGAKRVKAGALTITDTYTDEAPTNGLFVKGQGVFRNNMLVQRDGINPAVAVWQESGYTLQLYTGDGTHPTLSFHRGGFTATGLRHDGSGLDLLDGPMRASSFQIRNTQAVITGGANGSFRMGTANGWVDIGSQNSGYIHFAGDGKPYFFSHEIQVNGVIRQYGTAWAFGNGVTITNELRARHVDGGDGGGGAGELFLNAALSAGHAVRVGSWLVATSRNNDVMARYVAAYDQRGRGQLAPWHYGQDVSYEFLESWRHGSIPSSNYSGSMVFRPYGTGSDWSGGPAHKLVFADTGNLYHSVGNASGWVNLREIARYEENGYLFARSWINLQNGTGFYYGNGIHFWSDTGQALNFRTEASTAEIRFRTAGDVIRGYVYADSSNNIGFLNSGGAWSLRVDNSGFTYASRFYATSSIRYKDIEYRASAQDSISRVKALGRLGVAVGRYKDRERHKLNRWVIAEEVAAITGEAVALDGKGRPDSVDYDQLIPDLYAALANALERLEKLEARA